MTNPLKFSVSVAFGLAVLAGSGLALAGAPDAAEDCVACHHKDGISDDSAVPTLAGNAAFFLENELAMFAQEARPCAADYFESQEDVESEDHCAIVADLSEAQYAELAEYFESKPFKAAEQEVDPALVEQGESIHAKSCDRCHTEAGTLVLDEAGILAGQPKEYLVTQFEYYKNGERWQPEKMQPAMEELDESDMAALADYYASEGPKRFE